MAATFTGWGPYLSYGRDASTEMRVCWRSVSNEDHAWIRFGKDPACDEIKEVAYPDPTRYHQFFLTALLPEKNYYYQASKDPSKTYMFRTGPAPDSKAPFSFIINGDMHAYPCNNLGRYFDLMTELVPDHLFYVGLGDFINDGENDQHWNAFFHDASNYLPWRPLMNATGNHDTNNRVKYQKYLQAFPHHPYVDTKKGAYYLMEVGNAVLFFIDSCNAGGWEPTPSDEQYEWLEENLEKYARKDRWIFLFMHHQIYSTGDFSCAHIMHEVYRPLCQEYHVDAVFYGHDHHYECFWVDRDMDWGGTLYVVAGAGGGQHHVDHGIMGDRDGKTKYVWPGRFLNVRKHGIPPESANLQGGARGFRNDALVRECQLFGVLEPNFVSLSLDGDLMQMKCHGWQKQVYHHLRIHRAGAGREFSPDAELRILDY